MSASAGEAACAERYRPGIIGSRVLIAQVFVAQVFVAQVFVAQGNGA
jgi:hypothetical protein